MRYDYWVVRFVPDAVRGEFVNIAVIAGNGGEWAMRRTMDLRRASRLGGSATLATPTLRRIESAIEGELQRVSHTLPIGRPAPFGRGDLEDFRIRMNNLVQISEPRPVMAATVDEAADLAFELMIVDKGHESRPRSRTRVVRELADAFELSLDLVDRVTRTQRVLVGKQGAKFDFALHASNEPVISQLNHVWGFDLKSLENLQRNIQAWNFVIQLIREFGGEAREARRLSEIPGTVQINAIYTQPLSGEAQDELSVALDGWNQLGINAVPADSYEQIVERAEQLV